MTAGFETIAGGYSLPEGLRWNDSRLFFADAVAGGVYSWSEGRGADTVIPKRRGVGGIAVGVDGGLVVTGRNLLHVLNGETRVLFDPPGARGLNDLTVDSAGDVLVGVLRMDWRDPASGDPGEVWRVAPGLDPVVEAGPIAYPNGLGFSPDGTLLYIADYVGAQVLVSDVGRSEPPRLFAALDRGNADGLAVDSEGGVWVATGPGGSFDRFDPAGRLSGRIDPPATFAVTLCFGGGDGRELYLGTADNSERPELRGTIFRTRSEVPGLEVPRVR